MGGGTVFVWLLCDGPMSFAICGVSPYCHANGARTFVLLKQDKGRHVSLAVRCLSVRY